MYLVAQQVQSARGTVGINAVLYQHSNGDAPIDWSAPDLKLISSEYPGERVAQLVGVAPGGNSVICYLDIAARDGVPMARIEAALDKIATQISATTPSATLAGEIAVEFRVTMLRAHEQAPILFDTLRATIRQLLNEPRDVPGRAQVTPLRIRVEKDDRCWRFSLDPSDRDRVRTEAATLTVPHDVADDLSMLYGDLFSHVAEWLTGLSREQILELGGVRFEGSINRTWPE